MSRKPNRPTRSEKRHVAATTRRPKLGADRVADRPWRLAVVRVTIFAERHTGRRTRRVIVRHPEPTVGRCDACGADLEVEQHFADCPEGR